MCVALPGLVIETDGNTAKVNFKGNILPIDVRLVNAQVGDYVLVHAGTALEVLQKDRAKELEELFDLLEETLNET